MKAVTLLLLAVSLAANVELARRWVATPDKEGSKAYADVTPTRSSGPDSSLQKLAVDENLDSVPLPEPVHWRHLPHGSLEQLIARMGELGMPASAIRAVANAEVEREFKPKTDELRARQPMTRYWRSHPNSIDAQDIEVRAAQRALRQEKSNRLNALLGSDSDASSDYQLANLRLRNGNLDVPVLEAIATIDNDYNDMERRITESAGRVLLRSDREMLAYLAEEKRKDLLTLLTPEQLEERELRSSMTSVRMRADLVGMDPTEEEFRTIFRLQRDFDQTHNISGQPNTPERSAAKVTAERELVAAVKAALGDERGLDYERSRDPRYAMHQHSARDLGLTKETATKLWTLEKETRERYQQIGADRTVPAAERLARQKALLDSATATIAADVGTNNVEAYNRRAGSALRGLQQIVERNLATASRTPAAP